MVKNIKKLIRKYHNTYVSKTKLLNININNNFSSFKLSLVANSDKFKNEYNHTKKTIKKFYKNNQKVLYKLSIIMLILIYSFSKSYSWLYEYFLSSGSILTTGEISHNVREYDENGQQLIVDPQALTIIYETNISNITRNTKYIEIENDGTLDLEYSLAFSLEGTIDVGGDMYYRVYNVTDAVNAATTSQNYPTKLEAYAAANPIPANIETTSTNPVSNMTLLNNLVKTGQIQVEANQTPSSVYYRIDYGMYSSSNTTRYLDESMSIHLNVYSSQVGTISNNANNQIWEVSNEVQIREVLLSASDGDTIRLVGDVEVAGNLVVSKKINLDTNDHTLSLTGDLVYDFVNLGDLNIDVSGEGQIEVDNDLYINTPKARVHILGEDKNYDIFVGGETTFNAIQDDENDGILLENVQFVSSKSTLMPINIILLSNTRLTVGPGVQLGYVTAYAGSTNIEVVNNGTITQLQFQDMSLLATFTKPQIYVYNLGTILGVLGSTAILLPTTSTPYLGPNNGNTYIVRGITSSDITVSGSDNFDAGDINDNTTNASVVPITGEQNAYIVYIRENNVSVEGLLLEYFTLRNVPSPIDSVAQIEKLIIYTLNAQYFENEDFDFLKSFRIPNLKHLNLENCRIKDNSNGGTVYNQIKEAALANKTSLKILILPNTITSIGDSAFYNINLGHLSNLSSEEFSFITIPETVTTIGDYAFNSAEYVKFLGSVVPTMYANSFNSADNGAKIFVPRGVIESYQNAQFLNSANIFETGNLATNRSYFIHSYNGGYGISYYTNSFTASSTLGIPNTLEYNGEELAITAVGTSAYRHLNLQNINGAMLSLPTTVSRIASYAFYNMNITSAAFNNVVTIGDYAFYNDNIVEVIGNNITNIGDYAFYTNKLTRISLNNINTIGDYAFTNNTTLFEINFGQINNIGTNAFNNCPNVAVVYFDNINSQLVNNSEEIQINLGTNALGTSWGNYLDGRLRIYVPDGNNANGTSYVSMYKSLLTDYSLYVYAQGYSSGTYDLGPAMGINYVLNQYTVKDITLINNLGISVNGWEIISYQGADLSATYQIPSTITANGVNKNVISIGQNAYRNSKVNIGESITITNSNIINITDYAFYELGVNNVNISSVMTIGNYAFYGTSIEEAKFDSLHSIGDYALAGIDNLYHLNIGNIKSIGQNAISDNENLEQLFISNSDFDIIVSGSPFANLGTNAGGRFRIYVPDSAASLNYYRSLIPAYADYIYPTGTLIGSYVNSPLLYDIGKYSVKVVTLPNAGGTTETGWEIIEYHGDNLNSDYNIPATLTATSSNLVAIAQRVSVIGNTYQYNVTINNNGNVAVNTWQVYLDLPNTITLDSYSNVIAESLTGATRLYNTTSNGSIAAGSSVTFSMTLTTLQSNYTPYLYNTSVVNATGVEYPVISIGENAYLHTNVTTGSIVNLSSNNILKIGNKAFYGMTGLRSLSLNNCLTIGIQAFYNNMTLVDISLAQLKTLSTGAFANSEALHRIDLGYVSTMEANALTNAPYLEQVFFEAPNQTLAINYNSINNVGSLSNSRIRFYVTDANNNDNVPYVEIYRALFSSDYTEYFYPKGFIVGNYQQVNSPFIIGDYSVRAVTKTKYDNTPVTGWELIEYHGADLSNSFNIPSSLTVNTSRMTYNLRYVSSWPTNNFEYYMDLTNNGTTAITSWSYRIELPAGTTISAYNCSLSSYVGYAIISKNANEGRIEPGETFSVQMIIHAGTPDYVPQVSQVVDGNSPSYTYPFIAIGDYSFNHTVALSSASFDINNNSLIYIGRDAFNNLKGIVNISGTDITTIGDNAFKDNKIETAYFPNLTSVGSYAFANNNSLFYIHLGNTGNLPIGILAETPNLIQVFLTNTEVADGSGQMDMPTHANSFTNAGINAGSRFRIYVPSGSYNASLTYVTAYKNTLPAAVVNYIYETGVLDEDSYIHSSSNYNIHKYMVKSITTQNGTGWQIIDYHGPNIESAYTLPSSLTIGGVTKDVVAIGDNAFRFASVTGNYTFEVNNNNIIYVGDYAFYNFSAISKFASTNLTSVGSYAFRNTNLRYVSFPNLTSIGTYALADNIYLYYADLGNIRVISYGLLYNDSNLVILFLRSTDLNTNSERMNMTIGEQAFTNTGNFNTNRFRIYVPDGSYNGISYLTAYKNTFDFAPNYVPFIFETGQLIGSYLFSNNNYEIGQYMIKDSEHGVGWQIVDYHGPDADSTFQIPATLTDNNNITKSVVSLGNNSYRYTAGNNWEVNLAESVVYVGDYAFYQRSVSDITGYELNYFGEYACYQCNSLDNVTFTKAEYIGEYAFYNTTVNSMTLGSGVREIGDYALYNTYNNNNLRSLYFSTLTPPTIYEHTLPTGHTTTSLWNGTTTYNIMVYVPYASEQSYEIAPYWSALKGSPQSIIGASWDRIRGMGDVVNNYVYTITGTNTIEVSGYTQTTVTSLTVPNTLRINNTNYQITSFADDTFNNLTALTSITLPRYLKRIGDNFLSGCTSLRTISVANGSTTFSARNYVLFSYNGDSLIKFPPQHRPNNTTTTSYSLPDVTRVIIKGAFNKATNLTTITFNAELKAIADGVFDGCTYLKNIYFKGSEPPYLLGFNVLPMTSTSYFYYPTASFDTYNGNIFYAKYSTRAYSYTP